MDERTYLRLAMEAFRTIEDAFESVDATVVDCECSGDVISLTMRGGPKCIVNTQRPTRQIWLAANAQAYHFSWDDDKGAWLDDRGQNNELFSTLASIVHESTGATVRFGR
jgi:CyaY protein